MKTITEKFTLVRQGYQLVRIDAYDDVRFRATVKRDAYDEQGYALAEVWLPERGWAEVYRINGADLAWMPSYVAPSEQAKRTAAEAVYGELIEAALEVAYPAALIGRA